MTMVLAAAWGLPAALMLLDGRRPAVSWGAAAGLGGIAVLLAAAGASVSAGGADEIITGGWPAGIGIRIRADALGLTFALLTTTVIAAAVAHQAAWGVQSRYFPALASFLALGLIGLFVTADAFNFYVFFEVAMTSAFALAAYGGDARQYRAALTFAVVNLIGSVVFLSAVAGLYHVTGTLDMPLIGARIARASPAAVLVIAASLFVAFSLKLGLFPFHFWLPPVYRDTTPAVAAMLSGALANVGTYGFLRFGGAVVPVLDEARWLLLALGSASVLYGAVLAVSRSIYAEVLAYSSISQAGYVLLAIGIGGPIGFAAAVIYAVVNSLNKALLFLGLDSLPALAGHTAAIGALSVSGIPPTTGFFAKASLIRAGAMPEQTLVLTVVAAGSAISILYMARAHVRRYWRRADEPGPTRPATAGLVTAALALLVLGLGVWPEPLLRLGARAAAVLE